MYDILIEKISCGATVTLLLSTDGEIYAFGTYDYYQSDSYRPIPTKLIISDKICDIATIYNKNLCAALSPNGQFYAWGKFGPKEEMVSEPSETNFKSFNDIFKQYFRISYNTV